MLSFIRRMVAVGGLVSPLVIAAWAHIVFDGIWGVYYVPDMSTPSSTAFEVGWLGLAALIHLAVQIGAVMIRQGGSVWREMLDSIFSFIPLLVLYNIIRQHGMPWEYSNAYEQWLVYLFGIATLTDVVGVGLVILRILFYADELFSKVGR